MAISSIALVDSPPATASTPAAMAPTMVVKMPQRIHTTPLASFRTYRGSANRRMLPWTLRPIGVPHSGQRLSVRSPCRS
ncbi:MAG: hypothetical protein GX591_10910 [Planctomycetes bacterium]|nr:hypothetical protein [Planctomycetota bacterium]